MKIIKQNPLMQMKQIRSYVILKVLFQMENICRKRENVKDNHHFECNNENENSSKINEVLIFYESEFLSELSAFVDPLVLYHLNKLDTENSHVSCQKVVSGQEMIRKSYYKCPNKWCLKSYISMGGLKYHLKHTNCGKNINLKNLKNP
ncbi:hypothetical protein RCL_jg19839.t1 [Rhizophagus clarus]|uniref:Uncharacterized protein n=1 Tax=Rhizophagus clarus TaxID=94130 RepID=A0A8H3LDB8_9GLOM|nr:hypothetical protein RCL_jg19839.t1 [Rhizophagus clarus]